MCKRLCLTAALLMIVTLLAPFEVSAAPAYAEGLTFGASNHPNASAATSITLKATKRVDGNWRQTTIEFGKGCHRCTPFRGVGILNGDADGLDVSRDLGWGGLDGQALLVDAATGEQHLYEFHLRSSATERAYTEDEASGYFQRPTLIEGVILVDGVQAWHFPFTGTYAHAVYGINFSDQWPGY